MRTVPQVAWEVRVADETAVIVGAEPWMPVYRTWHAPMVRLASLLVSDPVAAQDIVHDVFARLIEAGASVTDPPAYLRSAVVKRSRSHIRRLVVARRHIGERPRPPVSPQEQVEQTEVATTVWAAVARLPLRQREAVALRYLSELSEPEVAAAMGVSVGSVKTHLHRARTALSVTLGAQR